MADFLVLFDELLCGFVLPVCVLYSMAMGVRPVVDAQGCFHLVLKQPTHLQIVWQMLFSPVHVVPLAIQQMPAACHVMTGSLCLALSYTPIMRQTQASLGRTAAFTL